MVSNREICSVDSFVESLGNAKKTLGFNNEIFLRLFDSFIRNTGLSLEEIEVAIQESSQRDIKLKMHGLRGILRTLHVNKVADVCEKLEYSDGNIPDDEFWGLTESVVNAIIFIHGQQNEIRGKIATLS